MLLNINRILYNISASTKLVPFKKEQTETTEAFSICARYYTCMQYTNNINFTQNNNDVNDREIRS